MTMYQKILLATDFSEFTDELLNRTLAIAKVSGAEICLLHVVEPLPILEAGYAQALPFDLDLTEQLLSKAKNHLQALAEKLDIPSERQWVEVGSPKGEIVRMAVEQNIDLIVIGTHGRHGFGLLLGSTAASVVNHAGCDVLTVRLSAP